MPRKKVVVTPSKNKNKKTSYPSSHTIIVDTARHNIGQMTSANKGLYSLLFHHHV